MSDDKSLHTTDGMTIGDEQLEGVAGGTEGRRLPTMPSQHYPVSILCPSCLKETTYMSDMKEQVVTCGRCGHQWTMYNT